MFFATIAPSLRESAATGHRILASPRAVERYNIALRIIAPDIQSVVLHQAMDEETCKLMAAKDIDTTSFNKIKQHIETRYLEELGRKTSTGDRKGFNAVEEARDEEWYYEWRRQRVERLQRGQAWKEEGQWRRQV